MSRKVFRRGVTETSTTLSDLGEIGDKRFEDGKTYRLVYSAATQAAGAFLGHATADGSWSSYQVEAATHTKPVVGYNATGASIAVSTYFWAQIEGPISLASTQLAEAITANGYLALSSDETVKMMDSNEAWNVAIVGFSNAAIATDASGSIWLQVPSLPGVGA